MFHLPCENNGMLAVISFLHNSPPELSSACNALFRPLARSGSCRTKTRRTIIFRAQSIIKERLKSRRIPAGKFGPFTAAKILQMSVPYWECFGAC
jgi:hypothetical protein